MLVAIQLHNRRCLFQVVAFFLGDIKDPQNGLMDALIQDIMELLGVQPPWIQMDIMSKTVLLTSGVRLTILIAVFVCFPGTFTMQVFRKKKLGIISVY